MGRCRHRPGTRKSPYGTSSTNRELHVRPATPGAERKRRRRRTLVILVNKETKVLVQGATGKMGSTHTKRMIEYGTKIVGGVTPGKGGETIHGVPVFDTVHEGVEKTGATVSCIFVPPYMALDAALEALDAGI